MSNIFNGLASPLVHLIQRRQAVQLRLGERVEAGHMRAGELLPGCQLSTLPSGTAGRLLKNDTVPQSNRIE